LIVLVNIFLRVNKYNIIKKHSKVLKNKLKMMPISIYKWVVCSTGIGNHLWGNPRKRGGRGAQGGETGLTGGVWGRGRCARGMGGGHGETRSIRGFLVTYVHVNSWTDLWKVKIIIYLNNFTFLPQEKVNFHFLWVLFFSRFFFTLFSLPSLVSLIFPHLLPTYSSPLHHPFNSFTYPIL